MGLGLLLLAREPWGSVSGGEAGDGLLHWLHNLSMSLRPPSTLHNLKVLHLIFNLFCQAILGVCKIYLFRKSKSVGFS